MNKKVLLIIAIFAIILMMAQFVVGHSNQDFDGHFTMDVPFGCHYSDVAWCRVNGELGSSCEYWEDDAGCELDDGEMIVYYYNDSLVNDEESDLFQHIVNTLNKTYLYQFYHDGDGSLVLTNNLGMNRVPPYLVGKINHDGSEAVFVGSRNLDDAKHYANTIEFR